MSALRCGLRSRPRGECRGRRAPGRRAAPCCDRSRRGGFAPTFRPSSLGHQGILRRVRRDHSSPLLTSCSTNCSTTAGPKPSMSMALREAKCSRRRRSWAGQVGLSQRATASSASRESGLLHEGHWLGKEYSTASSGRALRSTSTTLGITSPPFSMSTVSPMRISLRRISSALCRLARAMVEPAKGTGSKTATGVTAPVRPTCRWISRSRVRA